MADWPDEYLQLVSDCENRESKMTEWQTGFVASIRERLEKEKPLSVRQIEILESIWEKVTADG